MFPVYIDIHLESCLFPTAVNLVLLCDDFVLISTNLFTWLIITALPRTLIKCLYGNNHYVFERLEKHRMCKNSAKASSVRQEDQYRCVGVSRNVSAIANLKHRQNASEDRRGHYQLLSIIN